SGNKPIWLFSLFWIFFPVINYISPNFINKIISNEASFPIGLDFNARFNPKTPMFVVFPYVACISIHLLCGSHQMVCESRYIRRVLNIHIYISILKTKNKELILFLVQRYG